MSRAQLVIAIDGPSGAGKSTAGRALAERLGYTFIDTGAMYRAVAWQARQSRVSFEDAEALGALARGMRIELSGSHPRVFVDGVEVTSELRTPDMSQAASRVSGAAPVRRALVALQRAMGRGGGVVMDGRDIGSVVFPDAELKFFVDATPDQRARRRQQELSAAGTRAELEAVERDIRVRDEADSTRAESPLVRLPDAIYLDTTHLAPGGVVERMLAALDERRGAGRG